MRENPRPFEIYKHFKGNLYQIITLATDSEDGSQQVVYQALYGDFKVYVRPLSMFLSETDHAKYPNCTQKYRFERVQLAASETESRDKEPAAAAPASATLASEPVIADDFVIEQAEREAEQYEGSLALDPAVIDFLDAKTNEERLNILASLQHRITDEMINTMAVSLDIEIEPGQTQDRYRSLKNCLLMKQKFEKQRI